MTSLTRKSSFQHHRPTSHPTYRMPPLTPTVATLIHTAAAPKKEASPKTRPKIMKQGTEKQFCMFLPTTYS